MPTFNGTDANDEIVGSKGSDELLGFGGDDTLYGGDGDDYLDGGAGKDAAVYSGLVTDYKFLYEKNTGLLMVSDSAPNRDGIDTVINVETFRFGKTTKTLADLIILASGAGNNDTTSGVPNIGQIVNGTDADDSFGSGSGDDTLNGAGGFDTMLYFGPRANYTFGRTAAGFTVTDKTGVTGTDTLQNMERIKFFDGGLAFDTGPTQSAGETQLLLGAVLGKDLLATKKLLIGTAIDLFDQGFTLQQLSGAIMRLDIWGALANGGQPQASPTQIANYLLTTVNRLAPDSATLAAAVTALNTEAGAAQGNFLWHLAESAANQVQVGLVGLASTGLEFGT